MPTDYLIHGGLVTGAALPRGKAEPCCLRFRGKGRNVHLRLGDINDTLWAHVPGLFRDLIDIATFVYCADQVGWRGSDKDENFGDRWRRRLHFAIAVRHPDVWNGAAVRDRLTDALSFLSEDEYCFSFEPLRESDLAQDYFDFGEPRLAGDVEDVLLFSGGLDSLAGAAEAVKSGQRVLLVNHRPNTKLEPVVQGLAHELAVRAGRARPVLAPVRINKARGLTRDATQRSRSFLYSALAATFAVMLGRDRILFYENGIVSLNLPPAGQVVGARATRSTHPLVLNHLTELFSLLADRRFAVVNPFKDLTKTDVVERLVRAGCADLIAKSRSCAHPRLAENDHPHCGGCSQCIDRRFAVLAAGQEANDPADGYRVDLLTGEREPGLAQTVLALYAEMANQIDGMKALDFFGRYGEAARALLAGADTPE